MFARLLANSSEYSERERERKEAHRASIFQASGPTLNPSESCQHCLYCSRLKNVSVCPNKASASFTLSLLFALSQVGEKYAIFRLATRATVQEAAKWNFTLVPLMIRLERKFTQNETVFRLGDEIIKSQRPKGSQRVQLEYAVYIIWWALRRGVALSVTPCSVGLLPLKQQLSWHTCKKTLRSAKKIVRAVRWDAIRRIARTARTQKETLARRRRELPDIATLSSIKFTLALSACGAK